MREIDKFIEIRYGGDIGRKEKWKLIKGYEPLYSVSNLGRIRSNNSRRIDPNGIKRRYHAKKKLLKPISTASRPEPKVKLTDIYGVSKWFDLKTLVADHWLKNRTGARVVWKNKKELTDCSIYNIKEVDDKTIVGNSKLTIGQVKEIKRRLMDPNVVKAALAREFKISAATVTRIYKGERWKDVIPDEYREDQNNQQA